MTSSLPPKKGYWTAEDIEDERPGVAEIVNRWILMRFRYTDYQWSRDETLKHLGECESATAVVQEVDDGYYGCDTGCEHTTLKANIVCKHGKVYEYEYSDFGSLAANIEEIELLYGTDEY